MEPLPDEESTRAPTPGDASLRPAAIAGHVVEAAAAILGSPAALLHRVGESWRFEAEAFAPRSAPACRQPPASMDDWTALTLGSRTPAAWILLLAQPLQNGDSEAFLSEVAPRLGAALDEESQRLEADSSRSFTLAFHRFSRRLLRQHSTPALHGLILRTLAGRVKARTAALAVFLPDEDRLAPVATIGYPLEVVEHIRIAPGEAVIGRVFETGRPLAGRTPPGPRRRLRYRTDSYAAVPIRAGGQVLAVASFTDRADGRPFGRADLRALHLLAAPAGLALVADQLRHTAAEITELASTDPLTGLLNRRYFDERLFAELQRARRRSDQLALLMLDLDQFKAINDKHGHVRGDLVLRCVADRLRRSVRIFDVCTRYGGDEFAVLMPSSTRETALTVAERVRDAVRRYCSTDELQLTVSVGVAFSGGEESDVLALADRALIEAKRGGKDTVRVHD